MSAYTTTVAGKNGMIVAFRNAHTGEYISLHRDPRGGGALECAPNADTWTLYQASGAAANNFEVKRAELLAFNWTAYDNASDILSFVAWNHAKRLPDNTNPAAPHAWTIEDQGDGSVLLVESAGQVLEVMPDLRLYGTGLAGSKVIAKERKAGNARQRWFMEVRA